MGYRSTLCRTVLEAARHLSWVILVSLHELETTETFQFLYALAPYLDASYYLHSFVFEFNNDVLFVVARRFRNLTSGRLTLMYPPLRASVDTTRHLSCASNYALCKTFLCSYRLCLSVRADRQPSAYFGYASLAIVNI